MEYIKILLKILMEEISPSDAGLLPHQRIVSKLGIDKL